VFKITKQSGELVGDQYTTNAEGLIQVPELEPGFYVVTETKAPEGFV
jgi:uncharacterized surface anchored protein